VTICRTPGPFPADILAPVRISTIGPMHHRTLFTVAIALTLVSGFAQASHIQTTTLGQGRTGGVRTDSAAPLEVGKWSLGISVEYSDSDRMSDAQMLAAREADHEASLHSLDSIASFGLDLSYGLSENLTIGLHLPWISRSDIVEAAHEHEEADAAVPGPGIAEVHAEGIEVLGKSSGIGDLSVYGLWRLRHDPMNEGNLSLIGGLRVPTGKDDEIAATGERFESEFQPGSDSWDPFAGIAWSRAAGPFQLAASTTYAIATEGGWSDTDLGDQWTWNAGAGYRLGEFDSTDWNLVVEVNGGWRDREETDGLEEANSGGSWLFVSPGVNVSGRAWSVYASLGLPVDDELHGDQDDLGTRFLVGFQFQR